MNILVDIRNKYDYTLGHIDGAINIPYYNLLNNYGLYLNKKDSYILYCMYGKQSKEISDRLNMFGYKTSSLDGGYVKYM